MTVVAPQSSEGPGTTPGPQELQRGALGLPEVLMQSITTVAPAIGVLFTLPFIASYAGVASPLGYFLSFLLVLALAMNVSQLARHLPNAGGFFTYVSRAVHPRIGWLSGWIMVLYMPAATFTSPIFLVWAGIGLAILVLMRRRGREGWLLRAGDALHEK